MEKKGILEVFWVQIQYLRLELQFYIFNALAWKYHYNHIYNIAVRKPSQIIFPAKEKISKK